VIGSCTDAAGRLCRQPGECVITDTGIEGGLVYALSAPLRDRIAATGHAVLTLDLMPGYDLERLAREIAYPRGSRSLSSHLQSRIGLKGLKSGLAREVLPGTDFADPARLAAGLKALPLRLAGARPIDEAISTAGGVRFEDLDEHLMLKTLPGVYCAGEMLDWEAPTGGYLLTACFSSGRRAGEGALARISS
jgi:uncharacterized flavoprotein (TIGR03862 family)